MTGDRVVLVTGGSRGIGRAIVLAFARNGASVVFSYAREREAANEVCSEAEGRAYAVHADLSRRDHVDLLMGACRRQFDRLDVLVNNAGVFDEASIEVTTDEQWDRAIAINLTSVFLLTRAAMPLLRTSHGCIVNIASQAGKRGSARHAAYAASKGGVLAFTRSAARELASEGVRVNAVSPGRIDTDLLEPFRERDAGRWQRDIPLARLGTADEVAAAVLFLTGEGAGYITGETLEVNGGLLMD